MDFLIPPHAGTLCRQLAEPSSVERLEEEARATRAVVLSPRQIPGLDLLLNDLIPEFTGISAPYEVPEHPEIRLDATAEPGRGGAGDPPLPAAGEVSG